MNGSYFDILPQELITILLYKLRGTSKIYSLIDILDLDEELYFYKVCRMMSDMFSKVPRYCKIETRKLVWKMVYEDLIQLDEYTEIDILYHMPMHLYELYLVILYMYTVEPTPIRLTTLYTVAHYGSKKRYIFCKDLLSNIVKQRVTEISKVLSTAKQWTPTKFHGLRDHFIDSDGYIFIPQGENGTTLACLYIATDGVNERVLTEKERIVALYKGYRV